VLSLPIARSSIAWWIGKRAARAVAAFHCAGLPHMVKATKAVADRRAALLDVVKEAS
jgi:hypothetical protein